MLYGPRSQCEKTVYLHTTFLRFRLPQPVVHMLLERSKRIASTSPVDLKRDAKRLRLAPDLWSSEEHQQQDEVIKRRLVGRNGKPRKYDVNVETLMAVVLKLVGEVTSKGKHSHLFHVPATIEHYIVALEEDPELLRVVGEAYTGGSYKDVRCLSESFILSQ